jgi:hypothetical protein
MGNSLINIIGKEIRDNEKINVRKSINVVIVSSIYIYARNYFIMEKIMQISIKQ